MYGHLAEGSRRAAHGEITAGNGVLPSHWQFAERSFRPAERVRPAVRMTGGVGERETRGDWVRDDSEEGFFACLRRAGCAQPACGRQE